jgi:long-subunit acyl-CoA synthetase (AMP-forming)
MPDIISTLRRNAGVFDGATAFSDGMGALTRAGLAARVAECAASLRSLPDTLGLLGENTNDWVVAQLAGWVAGKTMVPIPAFFSPEQQQHILADCGISHVIATSRLAEQAHQLGGVVVPVSGGRRSDFPEPRSGGGQIIYTSGSTGRPKGVRLALGQIEHSAAMLAEATSAQKSDSYLSVLPLPLLLETICAICVPLLVGARTQFDPDLTATIARGQPQGLDAAFNRHAPTTSVLVPELLAVWLAELAASGKRAPASLRFVAIGGAPVAAALAEKAWGQGIPVHEGYGLSECCSVVSVNRPGNRRPGTVGQPLPGLAVSIDDGEIVVDGPTVMEGYRNGDAATRPWRTGDLGQLDDDGYLHIAGRKDNLIVTSYGRNVSPEWIEALLTADERISACAVLGHGEPHLRALIIPSPQGAAWFERSTKTQALLELSFICREAPAYAVPRDFVVLDRNEATRRNLLTSNGRFRRALLDQAFAEIKNAA